MATDFHSDPDLILCASHLIAINCHPFHNPHTVQDGLKAVMAAAVLLRQDSAETVEVRLFWHGPEVVPPELDKHASELGVEVTCAPHLSNGANLNSQIAFGQAHGFTMFYRVDGDDRVFERRFLEQARHLRRGHCDICGAGLRYEPDGGMPYDVIPPQAPQTRDFLENRFVLHPTMALNLASFTKHGLHYWTNRLEDKALLAAADVQGMRIENLPLVLGSYQLSAATRNRFAPKWLALRLNLAFLRHRRAFSLMPYAVFLFLAQISFGSHKMRDVRRRLYRVDS